MYFFLGLLKEMIDVIGDEAGHATIIMFFRGVNEVK
jgi:hypothetical protein